MFLVWKFCDIFSTSLSQAKPVEYDDEEIEKILFEKTSVEVKEEEKIIEEQDQPICQRRSGKITVIQADYGLIDGKFYFDLWRVNKKVKINQIVEYYAYRINANSEWKITKVVVEEWEEGYCPEDKSTVLREFAVIQKVIPVSVEARAGKILKLGSKLECNLEKVAADFLPIKGDHVDLMVVAEISQDSQQSAYDNIVEIQNIKARNCRMYCGEISHLREDFGIINSEVFFRKDACEPGYDPSINDMVLAKVIESDQGALVCRAILILPMPNVNAGSSLMANIEQQALFSGRNGIMISEECDKKNLIIGEKTTYHVKVENASLETRTITSATFKSSNTSNVMEILDEPCFPHSLAASECLNLKIEATACTPGFFSNILILNFEGDWQIACLLDFFVDIELEKRRTSFVNRESTKGGVLRNERRQNAVIELCATKNGFIIPGRKTIKAPPFLPLRVEYYPIPKRMEEIYISDMNLKTADLEAELIKAFPYLVEELNSENYRNKFHMLLHLEDLENLTAIKKYDRERVSFDASNDYLVMEIANLAESRPSLAVGDRVIATDPIIFKADSNNARYEGILHKVGADRIFLKFNESFHNAYNGKDYAVSFSHNRMPIRRCHQALNEVINHLRYDWLFPNTLGTLKPAQINVIGEFPAEFPERAHVCPIVEKSEKSTPSLKAAKTGAKKSTFWLADEEDALYDDEPAKAAGNGDAIKPPAPSHEYASLSIATHVKEIQWQSRTPNGKNPSKAKNTENTSPSSVISSPVVRPPKVLKWVNRDLNCYQREAVKNILKGEARPLPYIIFGPPGTGKTITVVEAIIQIAFLMEDSRILVATPSNSSADLICERLISWNLSSLIPGNLTRLVGYNYMIENRMPPTLLPYAGVIDLRTTGKEDVYFDDEGIRYTTRENIGRSKITIGTCVSLGSLYSLGFPKNHFTHIIIDEAGQSMEPEVLIPLAFMSNETQAIFAGDPRQLGPVVTSSIAKIFGLSESMLSRLLMRFPYHRDPESHPDTDGYDPRLVTRLLYNYRSLPDILYYYSSLFYESKLKAQICQFCSPEAEILQKVRDNLQENASDEISSVVFYGVRGVNRQDDDSPSWYNDHEIFHITKYLVALYGAGTKHQDIGIITPYQKQVMKIREQLRSLDLDLPKVGTVEEFQGQERNVIIISTVRSDEGLIERDRKYALGFVSCQQRLNVAISRAKALLIIIGNPHLLATDLSWRRLIKMCHERKCYFGVALPPAVLR